jgi:hypothetical protein
METQQFPIPIEVQNTEVIRQVVGVCLLGQKCNFACRLPVKREQPAWRSTYLALPSKLKQQLVYKHQGKLSKEILFLHDNAVIIYQKIKTLTLQSETPCLLT